VKKRGKGKSRQVKNSLLVRQAERVHSSETKTDFLSNAYRKLVALGRKERRVKMCSARSLWNPSRNRWTLGSICGDFNNKIGKSQAKAERKQLMYRAKL